MSRTKDPRSDIKTWEELYLPEIHEFDSLIDKHRTLISPNSPDGLPCWWWLGNTTREQDPTRRYPRFRHCRAHVLNLERKLHRRLHVGLEARHLCGNSLCVRPSHLKEGTPHENSMDKVAHGSFKLIPHKIKLSLEIAQLIRAEYRPRDVTYRKLAIKWDVSDRTIEKIIKNQSWLEPKIVDLAAERKVRRPKKAAVA